MVNEMNAEVNRFYSGLFGLTTSNYKQNNNDSVRNLFDKVRLNVPLW